MTIERSLDQLLALYQQACRSQPQVALITGDAGIGKTWLMAQAIAKLHTYKGPVVSAPFYSDDTPYTLTERILTRWRNCLDTLWQDHAAQLAQLAQQLGLADNLLADWTDAGLSRDDRLARIRQHLPWLKKMTPGVKNHVDQLLDLLGSPWVGIAQKRRNTLTGELTAELKEKSPTALAHYLVDEWLWVHQQMPAGTADGIWSVWLDGLDNVSPTSASVFQDWQIWLASLIRAVATAEQLKALLVVSCRSAQLSRWMAPVFEQVTPLLLGCASDRTIQHLIQRGLEAVTVDGDGWERCYALTAGNPAMATMLGMGLSQRRKLFLEGLTAARLDALGLTTQQALLDWWLVPLQLTPGVGELGLHGAKQLLQAVAAQPEPFTAPALLMACDLDGAKTAEPAFCFLQQMMKLGLIIPAQDPLHYQPSNRYAIELLAERLGYTNSPQQEPASSQATLVHALEVTLLTGDLDQHQLQDLWGWCQASDDPDLLTRLWVTLAERALDSGHGRAAFSGLAALMLAGKLSFHHVRPLADNASMAAMAWRLLCDLPWRDEAGQPLSQEEALALLQKGLAHRLADVRACALRCAKPFWQALDGNLVQQALQDKTPWVRRQALVLLSEVDNPNRVPVNNLITIALEAQPDVLPKVLPLLLKHAPAETMVPIALSQLHDHVSAVQNQWLAFLRQVPLNAPIEDMLVDALQQADTPDLIWTLYGKLWREAPAQREALNAMANNPDMTWPHWLKTAIRQRLMETEPSPVPVVSINPVAALV